MAISVNWSTKVISIPQNYLTLISGTLYELDTEQFRADLKNLEDDADGMAYPDTHKHNTEVTVAGITYARTIEIINGYSITFENGLYSVRLVGSNNNFFDVENGILNQNYVQVIPGNAAGLIVKAVGSGLTTEEHDQLMQIENPPSQILDDYKADVSGIEADIVTILGSLSSIDTMVIAIQKLTGNKVTKSGDVITIYEVDGFTIWKQYNLANGGRVEV